jgi:hypothetical protein
VDGEMVGGGSFWPVFGIIHPETSKTPILPVEGYHSNKIVSRSGSRPMLSGLQIEAPKMK